MSTSPFMNRIRESLIEKEETPSMFFRHQLKDGERAVFEIMDTRRTDVTTKCVEADDESHIGKIYRLSSSKDLDMIKLPFEEAVKLQVGDRFVLRGWIQSWNRMPGAVYEPYVGSAS